MKVFISQVMSSKSVEQVRKEREVIFNHIKASLPQAELIDSIVAVSGSEIALKDGDMGIYYLGLSLQRMARADLCFFAKGWDTARGCIIEREVADKYGKFCVELKI